MAQIGIELKYKHFAQNSLNDKQNYEVYFTFENS